MKKRLAVQLHESEQACAKLAEEHLMLTEAVRNLLETLPESKPDGLDFRVHSNLFALLGAARRERSTADYVRMSDGYNQAALLAEMEALMITGEWIPPTMTEELACLVGDLVRSGIRVAKLRLVAPDTPSPSSDEPTVAVAPNEVHILRLFEAIYEMYFPKDERRWSTTITQLTEVPCTLLELSAAGAVDGDVYLGLLQVILAIIVPTAHALVWALW
jgi:hypothetical protein